MTKTRDLADLGGGFIQAGTGAVQRTVESKLQDVVSVKDFGAVGDGVADDTAAIQAAIDSGTGLRISLPKGSYKTTAPINLKNGTMLVGDGREYTRIHASGNYPILQHVGSSGNTVGDVTIRSIQIRGQANTNNKQFGVFCDWGGAWVIEDCSFRLCKIGYYQGTSRNNVLSNCDFTACDTALWFGPIDQSAGGTPDNTVFMDTIDAVNTVSVGLRVEGLTGCKAINCSFVEGKKGIHIGNYVQATTPRAVLDGGTANVPAEGAARQIRWLHLTGIYTDSVSEEGWLVDQVATNKPTTQARLVNCWAGNHNAASGMSFSNCVDVQVIGATILNSVQRGAYFEKCIGVQLVNLVSNDFDRSEVGAPAVELKDTNNIVISSLTGEATGSTRRASLYLVRLVGCADAIVSNLAVDGSRLVEVVNSVRTLVSSSSTNAPGVPGVVESGTSNGTVVSSVVSNLNPTLVGASSYSNFSGKSTALRTAIVGGSAAQPAIYLGGSTDTGFYRANTGALGVAAGGVRRMEVSSARFLLDHTVLPDAVDDHTAGTAGVAVGQLYRTGSVIKVRVA